MSRNTACMPKAKMQQDSVHARETYSSQLCRRLSAPLRRWSPAQDSYVCVLFVRWVAHFRCMRIARREQLNAHLDVNTSKTFCRPRMRSSSAFLRQSLSSKKAHGKATSRHAHASRAARIRALRLQLRTLFRTDNCCQSFGEPSSGLKPRATSPCNASHRDVAFLVKRSLHTAREEDCAVSFYAVLFEGELLKPPPDPTSCEYVEEALRITRHEPQSCPFNASVCRLRI